MSVLTGIEKAIRHVLTSEGYKKLSQWTSSQTVEFDDGNTAQTKVGAINGITDSLTATSSNVALSAQAGKTLSDRINTKQNTINGAATTITGNNLTADRIMATNSAGKVSVSSISTSDLVQLVNNNIVFSVYDGAVTTMSFLFQTLSTPTVHWLTTEMITDKPATNKYGNIILTKYSATRATAICICTDGSLYVNSWNASTSAATGWIEK